MNSGASTMPRKILAAVDRPTAPPTRRVGARQPPVRSRALRARETPMAVKAGFPRAQGAIRTVVRKAANRIGVDKLVMPGLVPGIHVFFQLAGISRGWRGQARP